MATIGESIDAKVKEYVDLYERFRGDAEFHGRASGLATHDLIMQKYIAGEALVKVKEYIRDRENEDDVAIRKVCLDSLGDGE